MSNDNLMASAAIPDFAGTNEHTLESARLEALAELDGDVKKEARNPDSLLVHEAYDRLSMLSDMFESFIIEHPSILASKEWYHKAIRVSILLSELTSDVEAVHFKEDEANE